jgi:hypothetical protein
MLYHGTNPERIQEFEKQLGERFTLGLLGYVHWYLESRMNQWENFDIEVDQSRYCKAIIKKYLETAGCPNNIRQHDMPLPSGFIPTADDCAASKSEAQQLAIEFKIEFASCIGSLIYLSMTRTDLYMR